jgi:hypothetical protein
MGRALALGGVAFAAMLVLHVALWRIRRPRGDIAGLFLIFFVVPGALAALLLALGVGHVIAAPGVETVAAAFLLHAALASAYIMSYPAAQAHSPSLQVLLAVSRKMPEGVARASLLDSLDHDGSMSARISDLVANGLVTRSGDSYVLSSKAQRLVRTFRGYRALLGIKTKGG